jgi:hypothetical protein
MAAFFTEPLAILEFFFSEIASEASELLSLRRSASQM